MVEEESRGEGSNDLGSNRLKPLVIPVDAHVYIKEGEIVFDTEDAKMQILRHQDVIKLLRKLSAHL